MKRKQWTKLARGVAAGVVAVAGLGLWGGVAARGEAILQVFNQSHNEIAARLPEIAEAGYTALWVPPPTKANGGMSVGYDLNDPFDIGNSDLRGTWSTRYGVEADLHNLIELCHRFGMRVYFDNVMNHRSYDIPGFNEETATDVYPGMCPEDFHLRTTSDGFYRKWDNVRDWNDEWQVMFLGLSDLLDIAHETPNQNFGTSEGSWHEKPSYVRHPNNPEYYCYDPDGNYVGFGNVTAEMLAEHPDAYKEDVGGYLIRAVRWLVDRTKVDGLRLDAVKHVPYYFFGEQNSSTSSQGYVGNVQLQFNLSRGFGDWADHRDSVFNSDAPRNDAMLFGEHLGNPPPQGPYVSAGMRLVDDRLRNELNWRFSANQLDGFDGDCAGSELGWEHGVMHAQSHDNDFVDRKPLHHAMYFMRRGLGLVYSDGNNHAETLTGSGGAFPRWAQTDFLGQWHQKQIPTLLHAHENFARYDQVPKYSQGNYIAFQRGGNGDHATMLFMLNSSWDGWQRSMTQGDFGDRAYLYDYASDMYMPKLAVEGWPETAYAWGWQLKKPDDGGEVEIPPNSYAIWNWKNPDPSWLYPTPYPECFVSADDDRIIAPDSRVITLLEDGMVVAPVMVKRKDGVDGDPDFNPYGVADTNNTDYSYSIAIPRVTKGTNVTLAVKGDGSAESLLLRLDGGMDFGNGINGYYKEYNDSYDPEKYEIREDWRDNPPGAAHDFYLGFENAGKWFTRRIWSEKFAALDTANCMIGTRGATSYESTGSGAQGPGTENSYSGPSVEAPGFVWHHPEADTQLVPVETGETGVSSHTYWTKASEQGQGSVDGFGDWQDESWGGDGDGASGWFLHGTVEATGLTGFEGGQAYGLWAKYTEGSSPNAQVTRVFSSDQTLNRTSVRVGMKLGSGIDNSYKGVEFTDAEGNSLFGVQMGTGDTEVTYYGTGELSGTWSSGSGTESFWVILTRTEGGYEVTGTTRTGGEFGPLKVTTAATVKGFKAYMNGVNNDSTTDERQLYFDDLSYTVEQVDPVVEWKQEPQFKRSGTGATVWAKTSQEQGARAFLYYTVDGEHWPEGGGGVPANPYTKALEGYWKCHSEDGSWWRFDLSGIPAGATLRYKISAFREMGVENNAWETVWPGSPADIAHKKVMMSLWTIPGLNFETQAYHKHNDYSSWTTGFKDGYHLVTARLLLNRNDGAPVANTFRQTFYLDTHVPEGRFMFPSEAHPTFWDSDYGFVVKTDNTVDEVWYHIEDSDASNDGPGNGKGTNGVEWVRASQISPWTKEDAQDTEMTKIWRFAYSRIPASGQATIRVRLREVSSVPVEDWDKEDPANDSLEALHVGELSLTADTRGPQEQFYIDWPEHEGTMVEAGWDVRVKYSPSMISGVLVDDVAGKFRVYVNTTANGSTNRGDQVAASELSIRHGGSGWWDGDPATMLFTMPNRYNGIDGWRYALTVEFENTVGDKKYFKSATRMITHKGPMLPKCIVTTPPETDSDGARWIITMADTKEAREGARELRETPIIVLTDPEAEKLELTFVAPTNYAAGIVARPGTWPTNDVLRLTGVKNVGTDKEWTFAWQVTNAATYRFEAKVTMGEGWEQGFSAPTNGTLRTATVRFRQKSSASAANDFDWDNDGVPNEAESKQVPLPEKSAEQWVQGDVFAHTGSGEFDSGCPDTDGDGLPDGLELGYRTPVPGGEGTVGTDTSMDTNGDGWPNFVGDLDPPFYNTLPDNHDRFKPGVVSDAGSGGDRAKMIAGSVTDPRNPDSDSDGLPDGVEDANRNGWVDGDGYPFPTNYEPYREFNWADGKMAKETWEETSPSLWDSDTDGLCDGYGEDTDYDGWTDMGLKDKTGKVRELTPADYEALGIGVDTFSRGNSSSKLDPKPYTSRAINYDALFAAYNVTDPAGHGTAQDAEGWPRLVITETDPLCKDTDHDGLPDGWESNYGLDPLNNGVYDFRTGQFTDDNTHGAAGNPDGDVYSNAAEYGRGSNPRSWDSDGSGGSGEPGSFEVGPGTKLGEVNQREYFTEFTWWTLDDLLALDNYNQGGNSSDIYRFGDGFDSSRDLVAFYFRDGGDKEKEGDGKLYFRVDLDDLRPFAEEAALNIYVAINFGQYGNGITALPDDVNCDTAMGWNALVGVYDSQSACVYRQTSGQEYEVLGGFNGAYFNSELDSVMWSVDRATLLGEDWVGGTDNLKFQVYTTRDFTDDNGGSGDKGGLNDFTDTIGDDWLCSDYWNDYNWIAAHGLYESCIAREGGNSWNHCGRHAKLAMVAHGNQAIEPGNEIQALVNNGKGAGYDRPVQIHNIYTNCPLNLHITPTLAMALQWAEAGTDKTWYSGPAFNAAIKRGVASGALSLLGSTYSDHILRYFGNDFNAANEAAARAVLNAFYGDGENDVVSKKVLWSPERVGDSLTFRKIAAMGYEATVIDQTPHLLEWFGREKALGNAAYKIQRFWAYDTEATRNDGAGLKAFVLSSAADNFRYQNTDSGLAEDLRHLFLRRAKDGDVAISSIFYRMEDFAETANADGYDLSLRWIANHPWIQVVTLDQALDDATLNDDDNMVWSDVNTATGMAMQDWVNHACNANYDKWFYGDAERDLASLAGRQYPIRDWDKTTPKAWGTTEDGVMADAWAAVKGLQNAQVKALAQATLFASVFETAFHNEENNNLSRWSYGEYMYPATDNADLMDMAKFAQSRTRLAAVYAEVDDWARRSTGLQAYQKDVDLDGEDEWILRNNAVMALFEAEGGVMVGAWLKDGTNVWQMVGNFAAQSEAEVETQSTGENSKRGVALKDVWVNGDQRASTVFGVTNGTGSLTFQKDGLGKTVRLADAATGAFEVAYSGLDGSRTNYVRNGLSPDLATLMREGQGRMSEEVEGTRAISVATAFGGGTSVVARIAVSEGHINAEATDQPQDSGWNTVNLRNAAQVRQVEVQGQGAIKFTLEFSAQLVAEPTPPVITVAPAGTQVFPVGKTSSFRVSAQSWDGSSVAVKAEDLPRAVYWSGAPSWDERSGTLSWSVNTLSSGERTNDWHGTAEFSATDAAGMEATAEVEIVVPWDADGNGVSDDWEWQHFRKNNKSYDGKDLNQKDSDDDGFSDYAEWVAGTDPNDDWQYIAWEQQTVHGTNVTLVFRSMEGAPYQIEATDVHGLVAGGTNWQWQANVTGTGDLTEWTGPRPAGESRMYRIKVPFFENR
ncbi:MAG: hypothetical protein J6Y19_03665 [Kiritimatiellae bacterium]|nr:hypothetical protein [Kiritimatiellia bacterium]